MTRWRLICGFIAGAETPVVLYSIQNERLWPFVLLFGTFISSAVVIIIAIPLYLALLNRNKLTMIKAMLVGGLLLTMAFIIFVSASLISGGISVMRINGKNLIFNDHITLAGVMEFFFITPLQTFAAGAFSALVGWLVAVGFKQRPPIQRSTTHLNEGQEQI